ncbi:M48 family metallopeptidase [Pseudomonadota bacterium]
MKYSNPEIPEGINTSKQHPLKEFVLLTGGVISIIAIAVLLLGLLADRLAHYIPFEIETQMAEGRLPEVIEDGPMQSYLDDLTQRIVAVQAFPPDMQVTVHYLDNETVNAFATLGGNVFMFRGLLEKLPNENAVAMVLAHEIAHIKHRHPVRSMGRGIAIALALTMVSTSLGDVMVDRIVGNTGSLTALTFSRDQEREADATALDSLMNLYGHVGGADDLFKTLKNEAGMLEMPEFFSTHPISENRINRIHVFSEESTTPDKEAVITPLPVGFAQWLNVVDDEGVY